MRTAYWLFAVGSVAASLTAASMIGLIESRSIYGADGATESGNATRVRTGLLALYDFTSPKGPVVKDRSGIGEPLNLQIADSNAVRRSRGTLEVRKETVIRSEGPASKIIDAVRRSNELTIEAWVRPATTNQSGPARIVTLSQNTGERNVTMGQDGDRFDVRLRTTETSDNGIPSLSSPDQTLAARLTHVVYTRDRTGRARIYINNRRVAERTVSGATSSWDRTFHLGLANEMTENRPWLGGFHLVAIYGRALSPTQVEQNFAAGAVSKTIQPPQVARVRRGLQVLYDFDAAGGEIVQDRSDGDAPLNLKIDKTSAVEWGDGSLRVASPVVIASTEPARRLIDAVKRTGALTLEAWVTPRNRKQDGPARILSLSANPTQRNFTLGQEGDRFDVRLRTTKTSDNGIPSLNTPDGSLDDRRMHVVYTFDRSGTARIYLNGRERSSRNVGGNPSNWNRNFRLVLANEATADRPWRGTLHLVAVYNRALSPEEAARNFTAGPRGASSLTGVTAQAERARFFNNNIAPLLARHCLECHDATVKKGGLDLSHKEAVLAGGENGQPFVPGKPDDSLLWQYVQLDMMPKDRPPLSDHEKALLREWISAGAVWSVDVIDPAIYAFDGRADDVWIQRLTVPEYIETVRSAVGVDIEKEARELLPPDLRADGFRNTAYNLNVDLGHVQAYAQLAEIIVDRMDVLAFAGRFSKSRRLTDKDNRELIAQMGKWLLRGPLDEREIVSYRGIATTVASAGGDFEKAVSYIIEAMLQSPRFIYRIERQQGDGTRWPVGDYELASRLSYIIWGGPPDKELMRAADAGELSDRRVVERQVRRMLDDPRARTRSLQFVSEWLSLNRLENLQPNPERFPEWTDELADDMRQETRAFAEEVLWKQKRPLADLLNAQVTYATPRLAEHYDLDRTGDELSRYDLSNVPSRGGLLTQGSILTIGGDEASMVARGLFVLHEILDGTVKDPPPCVDTTPVPTEPGLSQRAISKARLANPACGGCHKKFEPLAFGLEKFDGLGAYHEKDEHGNMLRDDGEILFPNEAKPIPYGNSAELMDLLAESDRVKMTITRKLTQFALGRPLVAADVPIVEKIHEQAQQNGGTYQSLITAIVLSDLVQKTRTERR